MTQEDEQRIREICIEVVASFVHKDSYAFERLVKLADGVNLQVGGTLGTKIGTTTSAKLGFYGATPVVRQQISFPVNASDLYQALALQGLVYH